MPHTAQPIATAQEAMAMFPDPTDVAPQPLTREQKGRLMDFLGKGECEVSDATCIVIMATSFAAEMYEQEKSDISSIVDFLEVAAAAIGSCKEFIPTHRQLLPHFLSKATALTSMMEHMNETDALLRCEEVIRGAYRIAADKQRTIQGDPLEATLPARP